MYALYAIYDRVVMEASQPFVAKNDLHAQRIFKATMEQNPVKSDFDLYRIAVFKDNSGLKLDVTDLPVHVLGVAEATSG